MLPPDALGPAPGLLVLTRHHVAPGEADAFMDRARAALAVLAGSAGLASASIARSTDDPDLLVISTRWDSVGDYRRAMSSYDAKLTVVPLLSSAVDEPTSFEILHARDGGTVIDVIGSLAIDARGDGIAGRPLTAD